MQILMILDTLILALVIIESFVIGLALAAWFRAHKRLDIMPKWAKLDDLNDDQIEEIKNFLRKLRSGNDAA